jgi:hypothetical protein
MKKWLLKSICSGGDLPRAALGRCIGPDDERTGLKCEGTALPAPALLPCLRPLKILLTHATRSRCKTDQVWISNRG